MFVDREALILGNDMATLIMRPRLTMNGKTHLTPISKWTENAASQWKPLTVKVFRTVKKFLMSNSQTIARPHMPSFRLALVHKIYA